MKNRILVVDDEKEIADLVEIYLVSEKFDVIKCYDGDTAIDAIEHEKIDLAILDIMLPGISGLELCRRIRKKENYPVIMLTAKDSEVDKVTVPSLLQPVPAEETVLSHNHLLLW